MTDEGYKIRQDSIARNHVEVLNESRSRMNRKKLIKKVAENLCDLMDDEWHLGRKMYTDRAEKIVDMVISSRDKQLKEDIGNLADENDHQFYMSGLADAISIIDGSAP